MSDLTLVGGRATIVPMNSLQRNRSKFVAAAAQAGRDAVAKSRAMGLPVTYLRDGEIVTEHPADAVNAAQVTGRRREKAIAA